MVRNIHSYTFIHVIFLTLSPSFTKQKRIRPIQRCVSALGRNTGGSKVFQILKRHGKNICNDSRRRPQAPRYMDATIVTVSSLKTITTISIIVMITEFHMLHVSLIFLFVFLTFFTKKKRRSQAPILSSVTHEIKTQIQTNNLKIINM